jgi:hypothetical protein
MDFRILFSLKNYLLKNTIRNLKDIVILFILSQLRVSQNKLIPLSCIPHGQRVLANRKYYFGCGKLFQVCTKTPWVFHKHSGNTKN